MVCFSPIFRLKNASGPLFTSTPLLSLISNLPVANTLIASCRTTASRTSTPIHDMQKTSGNIKAFFIFNSFAKNH
jgi:hypothetical protein